MTDTKPRTAEEIAKAIWPEGYRIDWMAAMGRVLAEHERAIAELREVCVPKPPSTAPGSSAPTTEEVNNTVTRLRELALYTEAAYFRDLAADRDRLAEDRRLANLRGDVLARRLEAMRTREPTEDEIEAVHFARRMGGAQYGDHVFRTVRDALCAEPAPDSTAASEPSECDHHQRAWIGRIGEPGGQICSGCGLEMPHVTDSHERAALSAQEEEHVRSSGNSEHRRPGDRELVYISRTDGEAEERISCDQDERSRAGLRDPRRDAEVGGSDGGAPQAARSRDDGERRDCMRGPVARELVAQGVSPVPQPAPTPSAEADRWTAWLWERREGPAKSVGAALAAEVAKREAGLRDERDHAMISLGTERTWHIEALRDRDTARARIAELEREKRLLEVTATQRERLERELSEAKALDEERENLIASVLECHSPHPQERCPVCDLAAHEKRRAKP